MTIYVPHVYQARMTRVVDGDTLDLDLDLGFRLTANVRCRLLGVDTPELRSKSLIERTLAKEATEFVRGWCSAGDFEADDWPLVAMTRKTGKYGRWLVDLERKAWPGRLKDVLIEKGLGKPYPV